MWSHYFRSAKKFQIFCSNLIFLVIVLVCRYHGSLTAPPCSENVIWTVFKLPVMITLKQLDDFEHVMSRDAMSRDADDLPKNFREAKPINERMIYDNYVVGSVYFSLAVKTQMSKLSIVFTLFIIYFSH